MAEGSDGKDVVVKFGAQIDDLKSKLDEVGGLFKTLTERFAVMAAVVGGGAAFKSFIDDANKITGETVKLAKTLGLVGTEAAALNTALGDIGSDADSYTGAFLKFNRQLKNNSEGLRELGVDVDGVKNGTISGQQAFSQAVGIVGQYKAGIDQTQISMKLFGRSVGDVQTLMKLTPALIEEARKKNEELNLNISEESVAASKKYKLAINDVDDVLHGLKKTIGEAVIPLFTQSAEQLSSIGPALVSGMKAAVEVFVDIFNTVREIVAEVIGIVSEILGGWRDLFKQIFGEDGPGAMGIFKNALAVIHIAFIAFRVGFEEVSNAVKTGLALLVNGFIGFGSVAERVLHFDFSGAKSAFQTAIAERNRILEEGMAKAVAIAQKGAVDIENAAMKPLGTGEKKATEFKPKGGDKTADIGKKDKDTAAAEAAAMNALLKAQEEAQLALTKEFLKETQTALDENYKLGLVSTKDYYAQKLAITTAGTDAEIAAKQKELADTKRLEASVTKPEQKLKFKAQEAQLEGAINVLLAQRSSQIRENGTAEADALLKLQDALAQFKSDQAKAQGDDRVSQEKAKLDQMKALRQISAEDAFVIEKQLEDDSYAITQTALANKGALIRGSELEQAKAREALQLETEAAERTHQAKITSISNQAEQERERYSMQAQTATQGAFSTMINGLLSGTQKLSDVFRQFGINIANIFTNLIAQNFAERIFNAAGVNKAIDSAVGFVTSGIAKMVAKMIGGEAAQTAAAGGGAANRTAINAGENAAATASDTAAAAASITAEGTVTAAAAAGDATRTATGTAADAAAIASQQAVSIAGVMGYAAEAAVAAMASVAAIPFVGWAMAPEVGAATYATGLAYLASAAGGWGEVPEDQIAQIHKKEMILPAHLAEGIRDMVDGTTRKSDLPTGMPASVAQASHAAARATPSDQQVSQAQDRMGAAAANGPTFNVTAIDAKGVKAFFDDHGRAIAKSLQNQGRNFVGLKAS